MAQVTQATRVIQMLLDMLEPADQQLVLHQLNKDHGLQVDVARMYSDKQVAERYDVHVRTVRSWITSGMLTGCRIAGSYHSRADWLDEFEQNAKIHRKEVRVR